MELFVREGNSGTWKPADGLLSGLRLAADESFEVALRSDDPAADFDEIMACVWLFKLARGHAAGLSIVSPYPSTSWIAPVRAAGVTRIFAEQRRAGSARLDGLIEVPVDICPQLHVGGGHGAALSVCGRRSDRWVLVGRHFASRCFSRWQACDAGGCTGGDR